MWSSLRSVTAYLRIGPTSIYLSSFNPQGAGSPWGSPLKEEMGQVFSSYFAPWALKRSRRSAPDFDPRWLHLLWAPSGWGKTPIFSSCCIAIGIPRIEYVLNFGYAESVDKRLRHEDSLSFNALSGILWQLGKRIYPLRRIVWVNVRLFD